MPFRVFASAAILDAQMGTDAGFAKNAHRAVFNYTPREGYLYVRSRAISSRCNDNFDMFPAEEIEKSYLTFIGKPVFVNHHNEDHRRARGVIIDAALHKDRNHDGSPDTWTEVLMEVDAVRFPRLAKAILAGEVDRTSMGCDVQLSKCSVCGNEATSPLQYCAHIPGKKGKKIDSFDPVTGNRKRQLVFEICSGLSFFENSLLVEAPADPTAFFLGNVEVGPGLEHLTAGMNKTASLSPYSHTAERPFTVAEGAAFQAEHFPYTYSMYPASNVWDLIKQAAAPVTDAPEHEDYRLIGEDEARGDSRPVSEDEFHQIAQRGRSRYRAMTRNKQTTEGLEQHWGDVKHHAYQATREPWGGATYNTRTGQPIQSNADIYAMTVRPTGEHHPISVSTDAPEHEFHHAMDQARERWSGHLANRGHHLGVFHDADEKRIDIDPVVLLDNKKQVEEIGAYKGSVGGAYHFKSGDGFWPPHVQGLHAHSRLIKRAATEPMNPHGYVWTKEGDVPQSNKFWDFMREARVSGDDLYDWDFLVTSVRATDKKPGVVDYKPSQPLAKMTDAEKKEHFHAIGRSAYAQARSSGATSTPNYHPEKKVAEMTDEEREGHFRQMSHVQGVADNWMDKHPVKASNIASAWKDASPEHKAQGKTWYSDANEFSHTAAHLINRDREGSGKEPLSHTQVSGLIGVYSPQAEWHSNLHVALHVGRSGQAAGGGGAASKIPTSGGKTTGSFTSASQARQASSILSGTHYNDALAPTSHKVRNFSTLIENGGDEHHVVVDRHASSVAHGARLPDFVFDHGVMPKLSTKSGYEKYANAYRGATKTINKTEDQPVHPHMVQAATWLHQQKLNNGDGRRGKNASSAYTKFKSYIGEVYPHDSEELLRAPGTGHDHDQHKAVRHLAYGETKSPEDVDTLRSENCTVCGNSSAWDGTQCQVCGYTAPPRPFGDPNTDIAQQKDIRKQVLDGNEADPNDPNQQLGQQLGNPEELQDQQDAAAAGEDTQLGVLTCNMCGTGVQPAAPTSDTGEEPPYPAEGDVCPVCKKGQLLGEGAGEEGMEEGQLGDEANMDSVDAEEGQEGDAPGGASQQQLEEDDGDEAADEEFKGKQDGSDDDDQDDGDSFDPKKKADKNQKASSFMPVWWKPVWMK